MLTYCLKCRKDTKMMQLKMVDLYYHQNVLYVAVKNQNL